MQSPPVLVMGLGNWNRGDDAVGLEVAHRLRAMVPGHCSVIEVDGDLLASLDRWDAVELAVIIDAVSSGATPGTIHKFEVSDQPLPGGLTGTSTHAFGLQELIELGRALRKLPRKMTVLAIEGQNFGVGANMSPECLASIGPAVEALLEVIGCTSAPLQWT